MFQKTTERWLKVKNRFWKWIEWKCYVFLCRRRSGYISLVKNFNEEFQTITITNRRTWKRKRYYVTLSRYLGPFDEVNFDLTFYKDKDKEKPANWLGTMRPQTKIW